MTVDEPPEIIKNALNLSPIAPCNSGYLLVAKFLGYFAILIKGTSKNGSQGRSPRQRSTCGVGSR